MIVLSVEDRCCDFEGILVGRNNMNRLMMEYRYDPLTGKPFMTMAKHSDLRCPFLSASELSVYKARDTKVVVDENGEYQVSKISKDEEEPCEVRCFPQLYAVTEVAAWGKNSSESDVNIQLVDSKGVVWKYNDNMDGDRLYFEAMSRKGWTDLWQGSVMMQPGLLDTENPKVRVVFNNDTNMMIPVGTVLGRVSVVRKVLSYPAILQDIFEGKKKEDQESKDRLAKLQECFQRLREVGLDPLAFDYVIQQDNSIQSVQLSLENLTLGAQHYTPVSGSFTKIEKPAVDIKSVAADERGVHVMFPIDMEKDEVVNDEKLERLYNLWSSDLTGGGPVGGVSKAQQHAGVHQVRSNLAKYNWTGTWFVRQFPLEGISCKETESDLVQFCGNDERVLKEISKTVSELEQRQSRNSDSQANISHTIRVVPTVEGRAVRVIKAEDSGSIYVEEHDKWKTVEDEGSWKKDYSEAEVASIEKVLKGVVDEDQRRDQVYWSIETDRQGEVPKMYAVREVSLGMKAVQVIRSADSKEVLLQADTVKDPQESFESLEKFALGLWDDKEIPEGEEDLEPLIEEMFGQAEVENEEQRVELKKVITPLKDIFFRKGTKMKSIPNVKHRIILTSDKPIRSPPRTMSDEQLKVAKEDSSDLAAQSSAVGKEYYAQVLMGRASSTQMW